MSLQIRFDDSLDTLGDALIADLSAHPRHPFAQDVVVVPSVGVGRWLQQRMADRHGVCAGLRIEFPGRFLWRVFGELMPGLPERSPFDPDSARWPILKLFDALPADADLAPLARRVADASPADRLSLAEEIAGQFETCLAWRRDWLVRWQAGRWAQGDAPLGAHEPWLRWLWLRLLERLPGVSEQHPYDRFDALLRADPTGVARRLAGRRVAVFGTVALSPEQTGLLASLAGALDLFVYASDPCRELWSDLVDRKSRARVLAERPDVAWLYENEPAVLGNWGRAQRDRIALLLALEEAAGVQAQAPFREREHPLDALVAASPQQLDEQVAASTSHLSRLQALQSAVLLRSDRPWLLAGGDGEGDADASLQIHATHGLVREAEVLHDCLLDCFAQMPGLAPADIAVFCASIDDSADAIESVFAGVPAQRRIPIAVSGRAARTDPLLRAAIELLELAEQRVPLSFVAEWLANPAVLEALGLDDDDAGALIAMFDAAGARWGLDARAGPPRHHWQAALDRLLLGAAAGGTVAVVGDVAPAKGLRRAGPRATERFLPLLDALAALEARSREPASVAQWAAVARATFSTLFARAARSADALARLQQAIVALEEGAATEPSVRIDAPAFRQALTQELDRAASAAIPSGAVSVCPIGGLRGLRYRVICLFGMDEGAYPRAAARSELDLLARAPRFGDPNKRFEDRGAFLDALLAARDRVIVLYRGRDARDDTPRNPSILVSELLDYVNAHCAQNRPPLEACVHPLHGFSPRAFRHASTRPEHLGPSFAQERLDTALALARPLASRAEGVAKLDAGTSGGPGPAPVQEMPLEEIRDALADPAKAFLRHAVGLRLVREDTPIEQTEPLWSDESRDRDLLDTLARRLLDGEEAEALLAELSPSPRIAAGAAGREQASQLIATAQRLVERCRAIADPPGGAVQCLVSSFKLGMHAIVDAWLRHAQWAPGARAATGEGEPCTVLVTPDARLEVRIDDPARALRHAADWAARIRTESLPLFPRTFRAFHDGQRDADAAQRVLFGDDAGFVAGEIERPWNAALYRDDRPDLAQVLELGAAVYGPILENCQVDNKGRK